MAIRSLTRLRYSCTGPLFVILSLTFLHYGYLLNKHGLLRKTVATVNKNDDLEMESKTRTGNDRLYRPSMRHKKGTYLFLHAAFWDDRFNQSALRIFGIIHTSKFKKTMVCRTLPRYNKNARKILIARKYLIYPSWPKNNQYVAVEFTCVFPWNTVQTDKVVLYSSDNSLYFEFEVEKPEKTSPRRELVVCVKPISGDFGSKRLVEWVETLRQSGVDRFVIFEADVRGSTRYVLQHYEDEGILKVIQFPYLLSVLAVIGKESLKEWQRYALCQHIYLVALNSFLLKYRQSYKYMMFIDLDEVLMPASNFSIQTIIHKAHETNPDAAAFRFLTAWHFEEFGPHGGTEVPDNLYMQKYFKSTIPQDTEPKSVVVADQAITINWHTAVAVRDITFKNIKLSWKEYGYLHRFERNCSNTFSEKRCTEMKRSGMMVDPLFLKYRKTIGARTQRVLDKLQLP